MCCPEQLTSQYHVAHKEIFFISSHFPLYTVLLVSHGGCQNEDLVENKFHVRSKVTKLLCGGHNDSLVLILNVNYYHTQTKLREGNVFTCVCLSTGVSVFPQVHGAGRPPSPDMVNKRAVRILLECILLNAVTKSLIFTVHSRF